MAQLAGDETAAREPNSLVRASRVFAERWPVVALMVALFVAVVLVVDLSAAKQYEASAELQIGSQTADVASIVNPNANQGADPQRSLATALLLAQSDAVTKRVRNDLKLSRSLDAISSDVVVSANPDSDLITITATAASPDAAARLANAYGTAVVALLTDASRAGVRDGITVLGRQLAGIPEADTARRASLQSDIDRLRSFLAVQTGHADLVDSATPPSSSSSPQIPRDVILAMLAGLAAGMALAFILAALDGRVRTEREIEALTGLRSIASIPQSTLKPSTPEERQASLEPYRILRDGLGFLTHGGKAKVVVVSSAGYGDGRTTVAFGLARAHALAGNSAVLIETDLRRPSFVQRFKLPADSGGLTAALAGEPVVGLLQPLSGIPVSVLPAGRAPVNPSELLRGEPFDELLAQLVKLVSVVIIDGPPLLGVADGGVLLGQPRIDACLIVARLGRFDRGDGRALRATLEQYRLDNTGLVVCGTAERDDYLSSRV